MKETYLIYSENTCYIFCVSYQLFSGTTDITKDGFYDGFMSVKR
jgi:hypothetical protein